MSDTEVFTFSEVGRLLGVSRKLVAFLVHEHGIPWKQVGRSKTVGRKGLERLRKLAEAHTSRPAKIAV